MPSLSVIYPARILYRITLLRAPCSILSQPWHALRPHANSEENPDFKHLTAATSRRRRIAW